MTNVSTELQECINECEKALTHLNRALENTESGETKDKLQHAKSDLEECLTECRAVL